MPLRTQKKGKQNPWTLEELKLGLEHFYQENKRYPTSHEFDTFPYLPSSRQIQRTFGGLVKLREKLGLPQTDLTTGQHSRDRARKINFRAHKIEQEVYDILKKQFRVEYVHREYFFTDDKRTRTDFFIYTKTDTFSVDVLYPSNKANLTGCLNSKMRSYKNRLNNYEVIFLMMNKEITQEEIKKILSNKKNKLPSYQKVMDLENFRDFLKTKKSK